MTEAQFVKNNTGVSPDWPDLPKEFLAAMYNKIKENEIKMNDGLERGREGEERERGVKGVKGGGC